MSVTPTRRRVDPSTAADVLRVVYALPIGVLMAVASGRDAPDGAQVPCPECQQRAAYTVDACTWRCHDCKTEETIVGLADRVARHPRLFAALVAREGLR